ncbi:MAG: hypothetical protein RLT30_12050, partial [Gammaproteobacteria bacterium]
NDNTKCQPVELCVIASRIDNSPGCSAEGNETGTRKMIGFVQCPGSSLVCSKTVSLLLTGAGTSSLNHNKNI